MEGNLVITAHESRFAGFRLPVPAAFRRLAALFAAGEKDAEVLEAHRAEVNRRAETLLTTYGDSILRYAYSYLRNMSDAEEILQDTLIQFLRTEPVFESPRHEKAWLLRVAGNLSKNRIAYNRRRDTDELTQTLAVQEREDLSFVWEAVKKLPVHYREAVHLFYQEGYSTAEIAGILGRRESSIRSDLRRGREKLRGILKEDYDFA